MSGSPSGAVYVSSPPWAVACVRAIASAKRGLRAVSGPSEVPLTKRDVISTPADTNACPSPARIACIAMRVVCSDDAQ